jgi:hypothetical protein
MSTNCNTGQDLKSLRGKMPSEPLVVEGLCVETECGVVLTCVTKTTTYEPKGKLSYTSETVYTDKDGAVIEGKEVACPIKVEIVSQPVEPPAPVELEGEDCEGNPVPVTGEPGQLTAVVQAAGTVFKVQLCDSAKDKDKVVLCDKTTGDKVAVITKYEEPDPVTTFWNISKGEEWTGDPSDLVTCPDVDFETDGTDMCDAGTPFIRWYLKKDGKPTGDYFDTDLGGQPYVVTNEAGVKRGECVPDVVCEPTISSAPGDTLAGLLPGTSISVQKSNCCSLKVNTSAGSFIVSKDVTGYSTGDFKCPVTVTGVEILSGTCDRADVIVTTQFSG